VQDVKIDMPDAEFYSLDDMDSLMRVVNEVKDTPIVALDTETTGLKRTEEIVLFWSLSWGLPGRCNRVCMRGDTLRLFMDSFKDQDKCWVFANAKFDAHMLANMGIQIAGRLVDIQVMHALLYEDMPHRLKFMMHHLFGWTWRSFNDVFPRQKGEEVGDALLRGWEQQRDLLIEYSANDAYGTMEGYWEMEKRLEEAPTIKMLDMADQTANLLDLFWEIEVPYTKVLWKCERHGAKIDTVRLDQVRIPMEEGLARLHRDIVRTTDGLVTNPNSNDQWKRYLFDKKKYPVLKKTKGGKKGIKSPSVDEDVRTRLLEEFGDEALRHANEHAKLSKLYGTYVMGLHKRLTKKGYIHTSFNQDVARTGRPSPSDPNMQNWPRADEDEYRLRDALICEPGQKLLVYDYSQLEMRILADMAKEEQMIRMIIEGRDIHMGNASLVFDLPYDDIKRAKKMKPEEWESLSKEQIDYYRHCLFCRQAAKTIGFGQQLQAELKLPQNGETYGRKPMAMPCCAARHSLSTCARLRRASTGRRRPDGWLVTPHVPLTRGARRRNRCGSSMTSRVNGAENFSPRQAPTANGAHRAEESITSSPAKTDGTGRMRRRGTIKQERRTTPGMAEALQSTTRRSHTTTMAGSAKGAAQRLYSCTTRTRTARTRPSTTWNRCVSGAIRCTTIARPTSPMRRHSQCPGKLGMFTLNYGMKETKMAMDLGITKDEAREKMEQYLDTYPAVRQFFESAVEMARDTGFAFTYLGRRRRLPDITSNSPMLRWRAERVASNVPIQGGAADIVKRAMILIDRAGLDKQYGYHMFHQVHDEIIGTCPEENAEQVGLVLREIMEHPLPRDLAVPLPIDGGVGNSWGEAK